MECGIKGCDKPAVNTYPYSAPMNGPYEATKVTAAIPLCEDHSKSRPDTLSREDLK